MIQTRAVRKSLTIEEREKNIGVIDKRVYIQINIPTICRILYHTLNAEGGEKRGGELTFHLQLIFLICDCCTLFRSYNEVEFLSDTTFSNPLPCSCNYFTSITISCEIPYKVMLLTSSHISHITP